VGTEAVEFLQGKVVSLAPEAYVIGEQYAEQTDQRGERVAQQAGSVVPQAGVQQAVHDQTWILGSHAA